MYLAFFELDSKPFQITVDPKFLWLGDKHKEALATLQYGILDNRGFLLLTGEVGTGKTILINQLIAMMDSGTAVATIPDPDLTSLDFYNLLADGFKLGRTFDSKSAFLIALRDFLLKSHAEHKQVLLVIDESQRLKHQLMEDIRVLSNIELHDRKLINVFFVGQQEFNNVLMTPQNRALAQRITIRYHIEPLDQVETEKYIQHRLKMAGGRRNPFKQAAMPEIYAFSNGIPRLINIICDRALLTGFTRGQRDIDGPMVRECAEELRIPVKKPAEPCAEPTPASKPSSDVSSSETKAGSVVIASTTHSAKSQVVNRPVKRAILWRAVFIVIILLLIGLAVFAVTRLNLSQGLLWGSRQGIPGKQLNELVQPHDTPVQRPKNDDPALKSPHPARNRADALQTGPAEKNETDGSIASAAPDVSRSIATDGNRETSIEPLPLMDDNFTIHFSRNSNDIDPQSYKILDRVASYLKQNPDESIDVRGYTDAQGTPGYNTSMSRFRANAVKYYLLGKGIPADRMRIFAMGSNNPVGSNDTAEGRNMNRRVEIEFAVRDARTPLGPRKDPD